MRTQFLYVGLLSMTLAGGLVSGGCDSNHTGQPSDPKGDVKLVRIMVMDADTADGSGRSIATDLLDTAGSALTTAVSCDPDLKPCGIQFNLNLGGSIPDFSCNTTTMTCNDPLAPTSDPPVAPIQEPADGNGGGSELRIVFDKQLDANAIEDIIPIPDQIPGMNESYKLKDGVAELLGPDGTEVDSTKYWDGTGSPTLTSDVILNPYGPAIVIKPNAPLEAGVQYTVVVHSALVHDRKNNKMADQNGNEVTGDYRKVFLSEALTALTLTPDISPIGMTAIATDGVIEASYNASADPTKATATVKDAANKDVLIKAYAGNLFTKGDPTAMPPTMDSCVAEGPNIVDFTAVDATGKAIPWAPGTYTFTPNFALSLPNGDGTSMPIAAGTGITFTVDPMAKTGGDNSQTSHPISCP